MNDSTTAFTELPFWGAGEGARRSFVKYRGERKKYRGEKKKYRGEKKKYRGEKKGSSDKSVVIKQKTRHAPLARKNGIEQKKYKILEQKFLDKPKRHP